MSTHPPSLKYRADVDGLRAVAVLAVLAYHAGAAVVRGGFVGVDIFFVISGYLISAIILREVRAEKFSIARFYERRIRRILPALLGVAVAVLAVGFWAMLPTELVKLAEAEFAALFSYSNLYLLGQSGYFDWDAAMKPMLHTWSLAVEEQFYIVFPVFIWLTNKYQPKKLKTLVIGLAVISFGWCWYMTRTEPDAAFYLPMTRAWELLAGTILSFRMFPIKSTRLRMLVGLAGAAMIVAAIHWMTAAKYFPGPSALLPVLGSALVIWAGEEGVHPVGRLLASRVMVFFGLISYSLYLWHWPVLVFQRLGIFPTLHLHDKLMEHRVNLLLVGVVCLALGTLSWQFVEKPFRAGKLYFEGKKLFGIAGACAAVIASMCGGIVLSGGVPARLPAEAVRMGSYLDYPESAVLYRRGVCFLSQKYGTLEAFEHSSCLDTSDHAPNVLLLGDSHAASLWSGLSHEMEPRVHLIQANYSACHPAVEPTESVKGCPEFLDFMFKNYIPQHHIDEVILVSRWNEASLPQLGKVIAWFQARNIPVAVVGPMEEYTDPLPRLLAKASVRNDPNYPSTQHDPAMEDLDRTMKKLSREQWKVPYISLVDAVCSNSGCTTVVGPNAVPLLWDTNHPTAEGSVWIAQRIAPELYLTGK